MRKIFLRAKIYASTETHVREDVEKKRKKILGNHMRIAFYIQNTQKEKPPIKANFRPMQNSNNLMDRSLFAYSKKDARQNSLASKKIVEKAISSSWLSFLSFTQMLFFSFFFCFVFCLFWHLLLLLKVAKATAKRWCLLIDTFWKQQFYVLKLFLFGVITSRKPFHTKLRKCEQNITWDTICP